MREFVALRAGHLYFLASPILKSLAKQPAFQNVPAKNTCDTAQMKKPFFLQKLLFLAVILVSPTAAADCFDAAAAYHGVNPWILRAIAHVESGFNQSAQNRNRNGTRDYGMMQINSIHLPELARHGVTQNDLFDGCKSAHVAAWLLRRKMDRHGNTWNAVGAYHSETPVFRDPYARRVKAVILRWSKTHKTGI